MKFGAIDIGSNGVRLLISRPLQEDTLKPEWKKVEFKLTPEDQIKVYPLPPHVGHTDLICWLMNPVPIVLIKTPCPLQEPQTCCSPPDPLHTLQ